MVRYSNRCGGKQECKVFLKSSGQGGGRWCVDHFRDIKQLSTLTAEKGKFLSNLVGSVKSNTGQRNKMVPQNSAH